MKPKAIYNPSGRAGEYSYWACNFYTGCSHDCQYCYCKRGVMSSVWSTEPKLKKCFKNEEHALAVFEKELIRNVDEIRKHGLFFTFTSDPCLPETQYLTWEATIIAMRNYVPVKILTKNADILVDNIIDHMHDSWKKFLAIGFTLTGHDELEPNASTNAERIEAMRKLHKSGYRTFASIEPIVDIPSSKRMIEESMGYCHLYKVGLMSGRKHPHNELTDFIAWMASSSGLPTQPKFYVKDSFLEQAGVDRDVLPAMFVGRDFNLFKQ